jgi:hypothetical protein
MDNRNEGSTCNRSRAVSAILGALTALTITVLPSAAAPRQTAAVTTYCSSTADTMYKACGAEVTSDYWTAVAKCTNLSENSERMACMSDASAERTAGNDLCSGQLASRRDACLLIGEARYDPDIEPADFDTDYTHLTRPNPYFPITPGDHWVYTGGGEVNTVDILDHTKLIDGVTCIVSLDQVFVDGDLSEHTNDWFCQKKDSTVWYFGEETSELESFDGDVPRLPEVVDIEGSFKAERNGDKGGIIFLASPKVGDAYYEEFSLGNAEDTTLVLSTSYKYGNDRDLDKYVPRALADLFCSAGDCIVTRNTSQLEPGVVERKYYARGVGVILETNLNDKSVTALSACSFDPRCAQIPVK